MNHIEAREINPVDLLRPHSITEHLLSFFSRGSATKELMNRLLGIGQVMHFLDGTPLEVSLDDVGHYIDGEVSFYARRYQPDARYNKNIENGRKLANRMGQLFQSNNYPPLINIMLNKAVREWDIADRMDERANLLTPEEREAQEKSYRGNKEQEAEISARERATGIREGHGISPEFLEVGGDRRRKISELFVHYAAILAKKTITLSR